MTSVARIGGKALDHDALIEKMFKSDDILKEEEVIIKLRELYNNDDKLIKKAYKYYTKRFNAINEHAKEFKARLMEKYQYMDLTKIMKKAAEYAAKYRMTAAEFHLFINLVKKDNSGKFNKFSVEEQTNMGKALGYEPKKYLKLHYSSADEKYLKSILELYKKPQYQELNKRIKLSAITYKDCASNVIDTTFDKHYDDKSGNNMIHPLLAAMFIPKIQAFDSRILMTSIPFIVNTINTSGEIKDLNNYLLYKDIAEDKNQPAYSSMTPYQDLYTRSLLQAKIWEGVLQLRNGVFYKFNNQEFSDVISKYPANIFDAPDMLFTQDASNILRRIMNAFSFNPTIVKVVKNSDKIIIDHNSSIKLKSYDDKKLINLVPIINVRLPTENQEAYHIKLSDNIKSSQWYTREDDITPVSYDQKIINSEDVLIFYVNRSFNTISINSETKDIEEKLLRRHDVDRSNLYHNYVNSLPLIFSNVQKINDMPITVNKEIVINGNSFVLRSAVVAESINLDGTNIIGDSSAIIFDKVKDYAYYYNPKRADEYTTLANVEKNKLKPITVATIESAEKTVQTNGILYFYAKPATN